MNKICIPVFIAAFGFFLPAYAQIAKDINTIHTDNQVLNTDEEKIHELDRQRNEALRTHHSDQAVKLQAEIDKIKAASHQTHENIGKTESDMERRRREEWEKCTKNPQCAEKRKKDELTSHLGEARKRLEADEAAAARISKDKEEIGKLEATLKQLH